MYAIGDNNGTDVNSNPRPANQFHVEDPQVFIGDYLSRVEVAPTDLFLSNRDVGSTLTAPCPFPGCYTAEFEARNNIFVGNGIYALNGNQNYLTPDGNFQVVNNARVLIHSANVIGLLPGTNIFPGGEADVYIQGYNCPDVLFRACENPALSGGAGAPACAGAAAMPSAENVTKAIASKSVKVYPNPSNGNLNIEKATEGASNVRISDLTGKVVYETVISNAGANNIQPGELQDGIYLLEVGSERFKIIISK